MKKQKLKTLTMWKITKRRRSGSENGSIKEDSDKIVVVLPVHDSGIELTELDEWVKNLN